MRKKYNRLQFSDLDIESLLTENDVDWSDSGKNIGRNWIAINDCPYCGGTGYHFAINRESRIGSCFQCGQSANPVNYLKAVLNADFRTVKDLIKQYSTGEVSVINYRDNGKYCILPSNLHHVFGNGMKYLKNRGFDETDVEEYNLQQTGKDSYITTSDHRSDFRYRIFIPIYMNRRLVSYSGRDWTRDRDPKYQHPVLEACIISAAGSIFNYDSVEPHGQAIIVEGMTDAMKLGTGAMSLQGVTYTKEQLRFIQDKQLSKAFILFDEGARDKAEKLANALNDFITEVKVVTLLKHSDVGEMDKFDALKLKHYLLEG